jgi:hypothetical protein
MKKIVTASAIIALLASPAFAAKKQNRTDVSPQARAAQAKAIKPNAAKPNTENNVMWGDTVRGADPDPFIRGSMTRGLGNYGGD